jgi:ABC-type Fe3+-hydroxamate transport system substrate-binding protein
MIRICDQMGNLLEIPRPAERIVSLVPSQTELLFDLGAGEIVVGITKFCIHPHERVKGKVKIGGTKALNLQRIRDLKPDLIIGNKEENVKEQIEILQQEFPVYISNIVTTADAMQMILDLSHLTSKEKQGLEICKHIEKGLIELEETSSRLIPLRTVYLIWENPLMGAGGDNFIDEMMKKAGLNNLLAGRTSESGIQRYPETSIEELRNLNPDLIILSSEPFPFTEKHVDKYRLLLPGIRIEQTDGEMFSWYGSSMLKAIPYLRKKQITWHSKEAF